MISSFAQGHQWAKQDWKRNSSATFGTSHLSHVTLSWTTVPPEVTHLAVLASVAQGTDTPVGAQAVHTGAPVEAGVGVTLVDLCQAEGAREAQGAPAGEGIDAIHTGATIETGAAGEEEQRKAETNCS